MKIIKQGKRRLFEEDQETTKIVAEMLKDLRRNGMDTVRKYSRKFDDWDPDDFELSEKQIQEAISRLDEQAIKDTEYCQDNVRKFAAEQLKTMLALEVETRPGIILGHRRMASSK